MSEYKKAGVDYSIMEPFKQAMIEVGKKTLLFPNRRGVYINEDVLHSHGAVFEYRGGLPHLWAKTQEDLGNKNWIAEWMYQNAPAGAADQRGFTHAPKFDVGAGADNRRTYYENIAIDTALMPVNDVIAQGAMPVVFTDQIEASASEWYADEKRAKDFASGLLKICEEVGMALPAGESASVKYVVNPAPPVKMIAALSGCATGIIAPKDRLITGRNLKPGDHIIGAASSGIHANGMSLLIKRVLELPEQFLTKLSNGRTLGEEALIPTRSYVALIETLLENNIRISALLPGTGDGVGKLAYDKRDFTYHIHSWPEVPQIFRFIQELGVPLQDCLKTFNWGVGYYIFAPSEEAERVISLGKAVGYDLFDLGVVEEGKRQVIFEPFDKAQGKPEKIILPPPGE